MLIGFGCSVPAIMATRTLSSERDRKMTILLTPFMSCSAKLPIYALFTAAFFEEYQALVMIGLYVLGIVMGILSGLLFKNTLFKGNPVPFVMELPAYRLPSAKSVMLHIWDKAKDFLIKAFTIIFVATIVIWFLQTFDFKFNVVENSANSMLAALGRLIAPLFAPLGFADWRASTALVTGLTAKEAVVSTLSVLMGASDSGALVPMLPPPVRPGGRGVVPGVQPAVHAVRSGHGGGQTRVGQWQTGGADDGVPDGVGVGDGVRGVPHCPAVRVRREAQCMRSIGFCSPALWRWRSVRFASSGAIEAAVVAAGSAANSARWRRSRAMRTGRKAVVHTRAGRGASRPFVFVQRRGKRNDRLAAVVAFREHMAIDRK